MTPTRLVPVELAGDRADVRIGLIVPFDFALDREYWSYAPADVTLHVTRTPHLDEPLGMTLVEAVSDDDVIADAVRELIAADPLVMAYACTSGSFVRGVGGEAHIRQVMIEAGARDAVTTSGALLDALVALDATRVAVGTPYDEQVTAKLGDFLVESGIDVVSIACFGLHGDVDRVTSESIRRLTMAADSAAADVVFLSCTNLATFDATADLERAVDKPVLSANQVTMWSVLRAVDRMPDIDHQLFRRTVGSADASLRAG